MEFSVPLRFLVVLQHPEWPSKRVCNFVLRYVPLWFCSTQRGPAGVYGILCSATFPSSFAAPIVAKLEGMELSVPLHFLIVLRHPVWPSKRGMEFSVPVRFVVVLQHADWPSTRVWN